MVSGYPWLLSCVMMHCIVYINIKVISFSSENPEQRDEDLELSDEDQSNNGEED